MKRLAHVAFAHPIPIPGTHVRQADFSALDGWTLEDEDGCITLSKGTTRFYTYVSASCVEATLLADAFVGPLADEVQRLQNQAVAAMFEPKPGPCERGCATCHNPEHRTVREADIAKARKRKR